MFVASVISKNFIAGSGEKRLVYFAYSLGTFHRAFYYSRPVNNIAHKRYISITDFKVSSALTWMTKVLEFLSRTASKNLFLLICSNLLAVGKTSANIYNLQVSFFVSNSKSVLAKYRKRILSTFFIWMLANKKFFSKNQTFF